MFTCSSKFCFTAHHRELPQALDPRYLLLLFSLLWQPALDQNASCYKRTRLKTSSACVAEKKATHLLMTFLQCVRRVCSLGLCWLTRLVCSVCRGTDHRCLEIEQGKISIRSGQLRFTVQVLLHEFQDFGFFPRCRSSAVGRASKMDHDVV